MPGVARVGDATDHGGTIVSGSPDVNANGIPVARVGDSHVCPIHGTNSITSGSPDVNANGIPVARIGDSTECGATIVTGSGNVNAN